jgi:hypothetical protein
MFSEQYRAARDEQYRAARDEIQVENPNPTCGIGMRSLDGQMPANDKHRRIPWVDDGKTYQVRWVLG